MADLTFLYLFLGLVGVWLGANLIVESAKRVAALLKVSQILVGLTVIAIGTSLPEIMTNVFSGIRVALGNAEASGIAIGTNIGSDIFQITMLLGLVAFLGTLKITQKTRIRDGFMVLFSIMLLFLTGIDGYISVVEGLLMLVIYIGYLFYISKDEHVLGKMKDEMKVNGTHSSIPVYFIYMLVGFVIITYASHVVVDKALILADVWGVSESFIGVLIIGVSTALPEFSTAIVGIMRGAKDVSAGTLIGSNITDPLMSTGIGAMIAGFAVDNSILFFDLPFWFVSSIIALLLFGKKLEINKPKSLVLIALYIIFVIIKIVYFR